MSSVGRWVLTPTELEAAVRGSISVSVGKILLSQMFLSRWFSRLVRKFWCVGRRAGLEVFVLVMDEFQRFRLDVRR